MVKSEELNFNGSVYSTANYVYNALDQVMTITHEGQTRLFAYDGYGRLQTKHVPEQQEQNGNPTYTTYAYKPDDRIESVTDGRGASATYVYNHNRHLVDEIHDSAPSGITPTANVTFGYDAVGNRTLMTDGLGTQTYNYNSLSQLMSESRTFNNVGSFTLSYDYNLAGELKKITDSTNMTINYHYDNAGRLSNDTATGTSAVSGSGTLYAGVTNYASNFQYRAWGGLKAMTDGKGYTSSITYDSRLRANHFEVSGGLVSQNYDYSNDGRISWNVSNVLGYNYSYR